MSYKKIFEKASDRIMSMAELMEDDSFKKIPKDRIDYYIDESMKIGIELANTIIGNYENIEEIYNDKQVKIEMEEEYDFEVVKLKGKYEEYKKKIILYDRSIKKMVAAYEKLNIEFLDYDLVYNILLIHELFHYFESEEIGKTYDQLEQVNIFKLFHIKKQYPIMKTSDIAANIFTKKVLNLSFNPKVLNYLYMLGTGYIDEAGVLNYFEELNKRLR